MAGQKCLDWKKLKPAKVSDNYRLCCSLAFLMYEEITRLMMFKYMNELDDDVVNRMETDDPIHAVTIAKGLIDYIEQKAKLSLDNAIVYICRFW